MNKNQKSFLNALFGIINMALTGLLGLILNNQIIFSFGSEYNGINSTITQIINTLLILEGGFCLASNVALFKPLNDNDINKINGILSATRLRFLTVGFFALILGIVISVIYPRTIDSSISNVMVFELIVVAIIPIVINFMFNMKYRVILLANQQEYIITLSSMIALSFGNVLAILSIYIGKSLLVARILIASALVLSYIFVAIYCRKKFKYINFSADPLFSEIKGTKNVVVMKIVSVIYTSIPIVIISTLPITGTLLASVYGVYKSIISIVKGSITAVLNAPRLSFGALFAEGRKNDAKKFFRIYETIMLIGISVILGTTSCLILPFVDLYTRGVEDIYYGNIWIATILIITSFIEIIHIPSGQIIQMSGKFKVSRKIQSVACVILIIGLFLGRIVENTYMILLAILVAAIILAILEILYTNTQIFKNGLKQFIIKLMPAISICIICLMIGCSGIIFLDSYFEFAIYGLICVFITSFISIILYYILEKDNIIWIFKNIFLKILKIK